VGCEARKIPAGGDVFLLDFSLYRTYQDFAPDIAILAESTIHI
jgi:hypothetical protein